MAGSSGVTVPTRIVLHLCRTEVVFIAKLSYYHYYHRGGYFTSLQYIGYVLNLRIYVTFIHLRNIPWKHWVDFRLTKTLFRNSTTHSSHKLCHKAATGMSRNFTFSMLLCHFILFKISDVYFRKIHNHFNRPIDIIIA